MKLSEEEQKAYDHYKEDLHYQASMFESSFGDGYGDGYKEGKDEGRIEGKKEGRVEGQQEAIKQMVIAMEQKKYTIETIAEITGLTKTEIEKILS
jgi:predicted transposase/invertase (TIGR01784 family)